MSTDSSAFLSSCLSLTPHKAISEGTQLSAMKKDGEKELYTTLYRLIQNLEGFFGIPQEKRMNGEQRAEVIKVIVGEYWWMKFEELVYVFTKAKTGRYGSLFEIGTPGRITSETLCHWLNKYSQGENINGKYIQSEREQYIEKQRLSEHGARKGTPKLEVNMGEVYERYIKEGPGIPQDNRPGRLEKMKSMDEEFAKFKSEYSRKRILDITPQEDHE